MAANSVLSRIKYSANSSHLKKNSKQNFINSWQWLGVGFVYYVEILGIDFIWQIVEVEQNLAMVRAQAISGGQV